jgi:hypothetical protein
LVDTPNSVASPKKPKPKRRASRKAKQKMAAKPPEGMYNVSGLQGSFRVLSDGTVEVGVHWEWSYVRESEMSPALRAAAEKLVRGYHTSG